MPTFAKKLKTVTREEFGEYLRTLGENWEGRPITGANFSAMQYIENGKVMAQSWYHAGIAPTYQIRPITETERKEGK